MRLVRAHFAVTQPLLDGAVLIPGVVTGQSLLGWRAGILEDLVFALEDGNGLEGQLVRVLIAGLVRELLLIFDVLMSLVDIYMSGGQSLFKS